MRRYGFICRGGKKGVDANGSVIDGDDADADYDKGLDVDLIRRRETKWLEMLGNWDHYMMKEYKKVRSRCRKGIPTSLRSRAWVHLCGAKYLMEKPENKDKYKQLCVSLVFINHPRNFFYTQLQ